MVRLKEPETIKQKLYVKAEKSTIRSLALVLKLNKNTLSRALKGQRIQQHTATRIAEYLGEKETDLFQMA